MKGNVDAQDTAKLHKIPELSISHWNKSMGYFTIDSILKIHGCPTFQTRWKQVISWSVLFSNYGW